MNCPMLRLWAAPGVTSTGTVKGSFAWAARNSPAWAQTSAQERQAVTTALPGSFGARVYAMVNTLGSGTDTWGRRVHVGAAGPVWTTAGRT